MAQWSKFDFGLHFEQKQQEESGYFVTTKFRVTLKILPNVLLYILWIFTRPKRALSIISYYFPVTMDILKFSFASFSGIVFRAGGSNSNKHRKVCAFHKSYLLQVSRDLSGLSMEADFFLPRFIRLLNFNPGVHFFLAK